MNHFKITYIDDTEFVGDQFKSDWKKIDESKKIAKLEYTLGAMKIVMSGYKQFNHLLECVSMGVKGITKIFLMGRKEDITEVIILDLATKSISKCSKEFGSEYGNQILAGWQEGKLDNPKTEIFRQNV